MLTKAIIRNYKSLFDVEITFESRLTVIVGPNGCGKSSVLKVIEANLSGIQKGNLGATKPRIGSKKTLRRKRLEY